MSAYGPALFVARSDNKPIPKAEQDELLKLVRRHAKQLKIKDDEGAAVSPRRYDYGQYEPHALGVLIFSSYLTEMMPEDIRADHEQSTCADVLKIGAAIAREKPRVYTFKAYYVED